jgi:hypothetical protein
MLTPLAEAVLARFYIFGAGCSLGAFVSLYTSDLSIRAMLRRGALRTRAWAVMIILGVLVAGLWPLALLFRTWGACRLDAEHEEDSTHD